MPESKMKEIARILGVEIGEEFKIKGRKDTFRFNECRLLCHLKGNAWYDCDEVLVSLLFGEEEIQKPILDDIEKKYLSRVIRPWRDKVEYIRKINFDDEDEFIVIIYRERESKAIPLPCFKKGTMYKGMEVGKEYSLEDLGL